MKRIALLFVLQGVLGTVLFGQGQSIARLWNEAQIQAVRLDFARPPVQARNFFHVSMAMYDAWAAYDTVAKPYLLGQTVGNYPCPFNGVPQPTNLKAARNEAISFAAYRLLSYRYRNSPGYLNGTTRANLDNMMTLLGYNRADTSTNYASGSPAALGNYIAKCVIAYGLQDSSNEAHNHENRYYRPINPPLEVSKPGNPKIKDPNRWQPLSLALAIDQNGNVLSSSTQVFQSPEWGYVVPFAFKPTDKTVYLRDTVPYWVYDDPGNFPHLDTTKITPESEEYKWNFELVTIWGSHLTPNDTVVWDISPRTQGNTPPLPTTLAGLHDFYKINGGDYGVGYPVNPATGQPYQPQFVKRGDYARVVAEFWADGPNSETPPGHWFSMINRFVLDYPGFSRRFGGKGPVLDDLEYDVKAYFTLGGAVHDAAIGAWGVKGWYDGVRPISALRYMAGKGQSSDPNAPRYHPAGIQLVPGLIEQIKAGDPLAGAGSANVGKIKFRTWRGNAYAANPFTGIADVDWILADEWVSFQRTTFVTPPFSGYISGHSTYSRSAAEALTMLTGTPFFPGGMAEYNIQANSFLAAERGPSAGFKLQWATYRDASNQASLSRIWGGIHPPFDDIPGRIMGVKIGTGAFAKARTYFYKDEDGDGFYSYEDCDDHDPARYPGVAPEICDGMDNDCDGLVDNGFGEYLYYPDQDGDGYGADVPALKTCQETPPTGYAANRTDCDDNDAMRNPGMAEVCDGKDNNCNGFSDESFTPSIYYVDADGDGFGVTANPIVSCLATAPTGYSINNIDCDDTNPARHPGRTETCDGLDNNCNGNVDEGLALVTYYEDKDGDGHGSPAGFTITCAAAAPSGYAADDQDCDDSNPAIYPGAAETCDGLDNNCNGDSDEGLAFVPYYEDKDGDGYGSSATVVLSCDPAAPAGYVANDRDCNDADSTLNPGAAEVCDGFDNNCNGVADEDIPQNTYYRDADGDGFGAAAQTFFTCAAAPAGYVANDDDCDDANANFNPTAREVCDGLDNNCDGVADEGLPTVTYYRDADGDGFGETTQTIATCMSAPAGYVERSRDCDDTNPNVNPSAPERCDGLDNNCNNSVDEGLPTVTYYRDADGDGFGTLGQTIATCAMQPTGYASNARDCDDTNANIYPGAPEIAGNGIDEDCNGTDPVGTRETLWIAAKLYPNPVSEQLTVEGDLTEVIALSISDVTGRVLQTAPIGLSRTKFSVSFGTLPPGLYWVRLLDAQQRVRFVGKVTVQR